ncbi:MAG: hypothetical protein AAGA54_28305, partial [Myxococcota bacterium]
DIRDLDGDGIDEWVLSPTELPEDPDVPGYYFPKWRTDVMTWNERTLTLAGVAVHEGAIPALTGAFPSAQRRSSAASLYPAPVVTDEACTAALALRDPSGVTTLVAVP